MASSSTKPSSSTQSANPKPTLTHHLVSRSHKTPYLKRAIKHPFLHAAALYAAGQGQVPKHGGSGQHTDNATLSKTTLEEWLHQDVHYTRAYIRFLGGLLARLNLGPRVYDGSPDPIGVGHKQDETNKEERKLTLDFTILNLLIFALNNIQREMKFFEDVCRECNLALPGRGEGEGEVANSNSDSNWSRTPTTRAYTDFLDAIGTGMRSTYSVSVGGNGNGNGEARYTGLLDALVAPWATEWCYFEAWRYAAAVMAMAEEDKRGESQAQAQGEGGGPGKAIDEDEGRDGVEKIEKNRRNGNGNGRVQEEDTSAGARKALKKYLIPNWSGDEMGGFVKMCAKVVNEVAEREGVDCELRAGTEGAAAGAGGASALALLKGAEEVFEHVLWLESGFWPDVE